jgi:WD40 repeat protein
VYTQESDVEYRLQVWRINAADPVLLRDRLIPNENVGGPPIELSISDDSAVVAWSRDTSLVLFNFNSGRHTIWTEDWKGGLLTLSHDGGLLAAAEEKWFDGKVRIWNVVSEAPVLRPKATFAGHGPVYALQFSPDGSYLATAVWNSKVQIQLIDAVRGKLVTNLRGHSGSVTGISFSRDGSLLVSGGNDATVRLWDVEQRSLRLTLPAHDRPVMSVAISPDGQTIASMSQEGDTRLWRGGTEEMQDASYWDWLAEIREEKESH